LIIFIGSVNLDRLAYLGKIRYFSEKVSVVSNVMVILPFLWGCFGVQSRDRKFHNHNLLTASAMFLTFISSPECADTHIGSRTARRCYGIATVLLNSLPDNLSVKFVIT